MANPAPTPLPFSPLWSETAPPAPRLQDFVNEARYDCIVLGAGITGCSAALHLAEAGARVCVLDRGQPGAGTSGRANGQVMAELALSPETVVKRYGPSRGEDVLRVAGTAPDLVFDLIARHAIACDARRAGWIEATPWQWGRRGLARRVASWQERGAPVELLEGSSLEALVGTTTYRAGILDRRAGTLNPLAYTRGLAVAALRAGAAIQGGVEARGLVRDGAGWRVVAGTGSVTAGTVIAATNAYTGTLLPGLRHPVLCVYGVQSATPPLPPGLAHILPHGHGFSDVRKIFFRRDAQGRLVVGGPGGLWPPSSGRALAFRWLEHRLRKVFPELRGMAFQHRWLAKGAAALDLLPHLYEPAPGLFAALGFAGRGIAMGTALGRVLARRVQGEPAEIIPFPTTTSRRPFGLGGITS